MQNVSDAELLRRARRDPDAFVLACERHAGQLLGWLRRELRDDVLARDVLAETFAEAWFSSRRFSDPGDGSCGAWLHGIARNLVLRIRRKHAVESRARARLGLPVPGPDAYADLLDRLEAEELAGHLGEVDEAVELRVIESLDYDEVGRRLHISPGAARVRVFRAIRSLRAQIGE